ncbi:MAG: nucleoside kinase [Clostridia bacterium]|nr:nucleoside kinase [Clostridia bacterium]
MQIEYKNKIIEVEAGTKIKNVLGDEISKNNAIAARFNNEVKSLNYKLHENGKIKLIDISDIDGRRIYRKGLLFVLGMAIEELYPEAKMIVNYQLSNSLLCEFRNLKVNDAVIENIKNKMDDIIRKNLPIEKKSMTKEEAQEFYRNNDTSKGRLQLELTTKKQVSLYWCGDYFDYFYGILPISTGILSIYEVLKYHRGILIRYPSKREVTKLPEFKESKKLLATLDEYDILHTVLNVPSVKELNEITRQGKIKDYILLDEALHEKKIANIADDIVKRDKIKMILIAGPSSSGKTTFAHRLGIQLRLNGLKPVTISVDNYFVERSENPKDKDGNYNFECIEAIDVKLFNEHLVKLLNGEEVEMPTFDFEVGTKRYKGNKLKLAEDEVLVIEGIHCLNDKLTPLIPKEQKYKIYISCLTVLNIDEHNRISTTDTRLIRRIVRDSQFRGYKALHTLKMWDLVVEGEENNIFPFQEEADSMFNSSLIYELAVLKNYAIPLLEEIDSSKKEFSEAKRLRRMLGYFESIPADYLPSNSLLREFVGGSTFNVH